MCVCGFVRKCEREGGVSGVDISGVVSEHVGGVRHASSTGDDTLNLHTVLILILISIQNDIESSAWFERTGTSSPGRNHSTYR